MQSQFEKLYSDYKHQVFFFVKKYVHGQDDIEDIVQDIFVHLWKYKDALDKNKEAVVFKTAKQEIANFYRKNKLSFSDFKEQSHLSIVKEEYDEDEFKSYSEQVEKILQLIPEKSKSFFLKHKIDGLSYSEIAKENSISKNAVAKHVNKVLHILKTNINLFFLLLIFIKKLF
ncbi:RNA polymerase sigma factor [Epilithonimonas pallida]|uniref:RNA polymerase sigma-70 factor, ECF subfamily n=1 Tax=Epilithonimonas pallida TaxID=373671 RepID=A0ABY1R8M4_9FLAO|nr:sigma-70 family RNA polymerase sigma factor [Epilithonimonas pallida]SMP96915.1 RNA polymerase sigma-70 factor, ECF subfamily [Epilithonimonas pallida]